MAVDIVCSYFVTAITRGKNGMFWLRSQVTILTGIPFG